MGNATRYVGHLVTGTLILISCLLAICIIRALLIVPPSVEECAESDTHQPIRDTDRRLIQRFSEALRFRTVTTKHHVYDREELTRFVDFIIKNYPTLHNSPIVEWELVNNHSLLYRVKGSDSALKPYLLAAHLDVVPVESDKWDTDPWAGRVIDGFLYGRGTIDVKDLTMAILESIEFLLEKGDFQPKRSFFIALGHDEEAQGLDGAQVMAQVLKTKYKVTSLQYVLDEGTPILEQQFPTITPHVAMIGVSEKGYVTLKMTAYGEVGHSSMAPYETAVVKLARAISRFNANAHPSLFGRGPEADLIRSIAPFCAFPLRVVFSNLWLFGPLVSLFLSTKPSTNALIRTTSAVTMISGGFKENVLPSEATAYINHRVHPYSTVASVIEYDKALIGDESIRLEIVGHPNEPHPISPFDEDSFGFQTVARSVRQVFGSHVAVVPAVMVAATDTRWYLHLTRSVYRFNPVVLRVEDMNRFHGHNERIGVENYIKIVNYYHHVILASDAAELAKPSKKDEL